MQTTSKRSLKRLWQLRGDVGALILALLAFAALALALWLALQDRTASGGLCAGLGLVLLAFVQLSRFKKFRGLGFEAELWEDKQKEAELLIGRTRELLSVLASMVLTLAPRTNRFMRGLTRREIMELGERVSGLLTEVGVEPADATGLLSEFDRITAIDLAMPVLERFGRAVNHASEKKSQAISDEFGPLIKDADGFGKALAEMRAVAQSSQFKMSDLNVVDRPKWAKTLRERILRAAILTEAERAKILAESEEELLDLAAWVERREIRRQDVFHSEDG